MDQTIKHPKGIENTVTQPGVNRNPGNISFDPNQVELRKSHERSNNGHHIHETIQKFISPGHPDFLQVPLIDMPERLHKLSIPLNFGSGTRGHSNCSPTSTTLAHTNNSLAHLLQFFNNKPPTGTTQTNRTGTIWMPVYTRTHRQCRPRQNHQIRLPQYNPVNFFYHKRVLSHKRYGEYENPP